MTNELFFVFLGLLRFETDGAGEPDGPRPFDYLIEITPPFAYVPSPGSNLLVLAA